MKYTVRMFDAIENEHVIQADSVDYYPVFYWGPDDKEFTFQLADLGQFIPNSPSVVINNDGIRSVYQWGRFFVMNENGKTVATYKLKNGGTPKTDKVEAWPGQIVYQDEQAEHLEQGETLRDRWEREEKYNKSKKK